MAEKAYLVVNARARTGQRVFERVREGLAGRGVDLVGADLVDDPARLGESVLRALDATPSVLIVGGGDGTLSTACGLLAGSDTALGVMPLGTANDFARTLGVPSDISRACDVIAEGRVVDVDLGMAGADHYLNVASIGFGAAVASAMSPRAKRLFGPLAYPLAALKTGVSTRSFTARLTFGATDSPPQNIDDVLQVAVGNGRFYGGGRSVSPDAGIDDAALDVYVIRGDHPRELIRVAHRLRSGDFSGLQATVSSFRTSEMAVETDRPLPLNVDGELRAHTPVRFAVAPNALRVIIPADSKAARLDDDGSS